MVKVYRRKFLVLYLLLTLVSIFSFSCSLTNSSEEEGYLSFELPKTLEVSRAVIGSNENENPTSYIVMLMVGSDGKYEGKFTEKEYLPGENVFIKGLTPDTSYTLVIKAESANCLYEGVSDKIVAKRGRNTTSVNLVKKNKAKVKLDLSLINLTSSDTFSYSIIDRNGTVLVKEDTVAVSSNSQYLVPKTFKSGTYIVTFTTSKSNSEEYYLENDGFLKVTSSNMNGEVVFGVTSQPKKTFYVKGASVNGNGTEAYPFNSLKAAINKISSVNDFNETFEIIVSGRISNTDQVVINSDINVHIRGTSNGILVCPIIIDSQNANVTISNLSIENPNGVALTFNNGNLTFGTSTEYSPFITSLQINCDKVINVMNEKITSSNSYSSLDVYNYVEGKQVFNTNNNPSYIQHYEVSDSKYCLNNEGFLIAKDSLTSQVYVNINDIPSDSKYSVKIFKNDTVKTEVGALDSLTKSCYLPYFLNVGESYNIVIYDNSTFANEIVAEKSITINKDRTQNVISFVLGNTIFVSENGNDSINRGTSETDAFATVTKALDVIKNKILPLDNTKTNYTICIEGTIVDNPILIDSNLNINLRNSSGAPTPPVILSSITLQDASITVDGMKVSELISEGNSNIVLMGNRALIPSIIFKSTPSLTVEDNLEPTNFMNISCASYSVGDQIIKFTESVDNALNSKLFRIDHPLYFINEEGKIAEKVLTIKTDLQTVDENHYYYELLDSTGTLLYKDFLTSSEELIPYSLTSGSQYKLKLYDQRLSAEPIAAKTFTSTYPTMQIIELFTSRNYYVSENGNDSNNGFSVDKAFSTISKAIREMENRYIEEQSTVPFNLYIDSSTPKTIDASSSFSINEPLKVNIMGNNKGVATLNCTNDFAVTINNADALLKLSDIKLNQSQQKTGSISFIEIRHGSVVIGENFTDNLCDQNDNFITAYDSTCNVYLTKANSIPSGQIRLIDCILTISDYFYSKGDIVPHSVYLAPAVNEGKVLVKNESAQSIGDACRFFICEGNLFINSQGQTVGSKTISVSIKDSNGDQNTELTKGDFSLVIYDKDYGFNLSEKVFDSYNQYICIPKDYETTLKIVKNNSSCYEEVIPTSIGSSTSKSINLFSYYVKEGIGAKDNTGSDKEHGTTLDRALSFAKESTSLLPSKITLCSNAYSEINKLTDVKSIVIDTPANITITSEKPTYPNIIYSLKGLDYPTTKKAQPLLIINNPDAKVEFTKVKIECVNHTNVDEGLFVVKQGTLSFTDVGYGVYKDAMAKPVISYPNIVAVHSDGQFNVNGGTDTKCVFALVNTSGTYPTINITKEIASYQKIYIAPVLNKAINVSDSVGKTVATVATGVSAASYGRINVYVGNSSDAVTHIVDSNGTVQSN